MSGISRNRVVCTDDMIFVYVYGIDINYGVDEAISTLRALVLLSSPVNDPGEKKDAAFSKSNSPAPD